MTSQDGAACRDVDPSVFLPTSMGRDVYREARMICAACPVKGACLAAVLEAEGTAGPRGRFGMFAGTTPRERARIAGHGRKVCVAAGSPDTTYASFSVCDRAACIEDAIEWAEAQVRLPARFIPDNGGTTGNEGDE